MQASVIERPLSHFVGLRVTAPSDAAVEAQAQARKTLLRRQFEVENIANTYQQLGVTRPDEPENAEEQVTAYIGFEVAAIKSVPQGMVSMDLMAGRYAQFPWKGPLDSEEFDGFYPSIFGWLQQQSLPPSVHDPWIEIYGTQNDWDNRSDPQNELTVLIPIGGQSSR